MSSVEPDLTVRVLQDSLTQHVAAFRIALDLYPSANLDDFLPASEHPHYLEILCELARLEMAQRWQNGKPKALEAYQAQYPALAANPIFLYKLAREELLLRSRGGEKLTVYESSDAQKVAAQPIVKQADEECENYPLTVGSADDPSPLPIDAMDPTRPCLLAERPSSASGPEILWDVDREMPEMPRVGTEFLGFRLLAELGQGAFGKVFLAQQGQLASRQVALKVATGLFNESQTLAQLQHTHIVPIYSYHHSPDFQAVCMPYLGSTTLAHVLGDLRTHKSMPASGKSLLSTLHGRRMSTRRLEESTKEGEVDSVRHSLPSPSDPAVLPARESLPLELEGMSYVDTILWLAVRLTDGLAHAHERGIIHRDLKPANILITNDGQPMLLDFNLAHDTNQDKSAAAASMGGTLPYMAPEHLEAFRGAKTVVDARSDLYALGVILYELLTGAAPFPSYRKLPMREMVERMIQDRRRATLRPRQCNKRIPPAMAAILCHCLQAEPGHRYQSARQLREDLQRQLEHQPLIHAGNPSLWERCQKFRRRHPRLTSMTSVVLISIPILACMTGLFMVREEQRARLEARVALTSFEEDAQSAYFLLNARNNRDTLLEGEKSCRATLSYFQVLENPDWRAGPRVLRLPSQEQERLHQDVSQLLVLLAHAQQVAGEHENDPLRRSEKYQAGLQLCSLARAGVPGDQVPQALWNQQGELHRRLEERAQAEKCFERARQTELKSAHDRYLTARALAEEGKFRAALPLIREAVQLAPQDFNLHFLQGICHDYLAQNSDATACYRACIALRPRFYGTYYNRGLSYLRQLDFKAAQQDFDQVLRLRPDFTEAYVSRASAWQGQQKYAQARVDLTEAMQRGFAPTHIYFLRAKLHELAGNVDGARQDRAEGMRREPTDELGWIARGLVSLPDDPKQALHDFDMALKSNPRSLAALQNKSHVLAKYFKKTREAVQALDRAIELYPDDCRPRAARGVYLGRLGKRDDAHRDAEQALLLDTSPSNMYQVAGIYALTSGQEPNDRHEALRLLAAALKKGYGHEYLGIDRDLDPIRGSPVFQRVVEAARALQSGGR